MKKVWRARKGNPLQWCQGSSEKVERNILARITIIHGRSESVKQNVSFKKFVPDEEMIMSDDYIDILKE